MGNQRQFNLENAENGDVSYDRQESRVRAFTRQVSTKIVDQFPVNQPLPTWILLFVFGTLGLLFWMALASITNFPTPVSRSQLVS